MNQEIINSIFYLLPELSLALSIIIITIVSSFVKKELSFYITIAGLTLAFILLLFSYNTDPKALYSGLMAVDRFAMFGKLLVIFSAITFVLLFYTRKDSPNTFIPFITVVLGAISAVSSSNLVMTFVSLEVISIAVYILLSDDKKTSTKYFIYSAVSSGILLYGYSLMYGTAGTADYTGISNFISGNVYNELTLTISVILIIAGLGFRLMLFPFSFMIPSVSENISLRKLSLITIIPLIAAILVITRLLLTTLHDGGSFIISENSYRLIENVKWQNMIAITSTATIAAGSLIVLWQRDIRKIFTFILIAQAGHTLIPLASPSPISTQTILFNLIIFALNALGMLLSIRILELNIKPSFGKNLVLDDLRSIGRKSPLIFLGMILFFASVLGLPLTLGFIGKLYIFSTLFGSFFWAGITGVLSSMALCYFIYKFSTLVFSGPSIIQMQVETIHKVIWLLFVLAIIFFGIYPSPILELARLSTQIFGI